MVRASNLRRYIATAASQAQAWLNAAAASGLPLQDYAAAVFSAMRDNDLATANRLLGKNYRSVASVEAQFRRVQYLSRSEDVFHRFVAESFNYRRWLAAHPVGRGEQGGHPGRGGQGGHPAPGGQGGHPAPGGQGDHPGRGGQGGHPAPGGQGPDGQGGHPARGEQGRAEEGDLAVPPLTRAEAARLDVARRRIEDAIAENVEPVGQIRGNEWMAQGCTYRLLGERGGVRIGMKRWARVAAVVSAVRVNTEGLTLEQAAGAALTLITAAGINVRSNLTHPLWWCNVWGYWVVEGADGVEREISFHLPLAAAHRAVWLVGERARRPIAGETGLAAMSRFLDEVTDGACGIAERHAASGEIIALTLFARAVRPEG